MLLLPEVEAAAAADDDVDEAMMILNGFNSSLERISK
jgi:hypothetical protein